MSAGSTTQSKPHWILTHVLKHRSTYVVDCCNRICVLCALVLRLRLSCWSFDCLPLPLLVWEHPHDMIHVAATVQRHGGDHTNQAETCIEHTIPCLHYHFIGTGTPLSHIAFLILVDDSIRQCE